MLSNVIKLRKTATNSSHKLGRLTLPSPKERVIMESEVKVLSFGEDYSHDNCFLRLFMRATPFR